MASDKHIVIVDETTGMLTSEVLMAYLYGELSPALREEVEKFIAADVMHRDMLEGLKQIPDRKQAERAIQGINEKVSAKTGAVLSRRNIRFDMGEFLRDYGKIAAALTGLLLLSAIIYTLVMMKKNSTFITAAGNETEQRMALENADERAQQPEKNIESATDSIIRGAREQLETVNDENVTQGEQPVSPSEDAASLHLGNNALSEKNASTRTMVSTGAPAGSKPDTAPALKMHDDKKGNTKDESPAKGADDGAITSAELMQKDKKSVNETKAFREVTVTDSKIKAGNEETLMIAERMPEFPGGETALHQFIHDNLKYPAKSKQGGIEGKVYLSFIVGTSGRVRDIRVIRGVNKEINAEAIRLISSMPAWKPGMEDGKPAAVKQFLTIEFSLD
ncbi:MAG TPA: energy transducer TonB [Chitinophagales bacterium]|nr:energy transducer TonB [Chitinophagales bacterium]